MDPTNMAMDGGEGIVFLFILMGAAFVYGCIHLHLKQRAKLKNNKD